MPVLSGERWPAAGGTTTITWSFAEMNFASLAQQFSGYLDFDTPIEAAFRMTIRTAFAAWEAVANIDFVEVADNPGADIRVGNRAIDGRPGPGMGSVLATTLSYFTGATYLTSEIYFDVDAYDSNRLYGTAVHEIGHALGLDHSPIMSAIMFFSINAQNIMGQLSADDLEGITAIYGARTSASPTPMTPTDDFVAGVATTGLVNVGGSAIGNLETVGDVDWFRVTLQAGRSYRIDVEGMATSQGSLPDPVVEVRNAAGLVQATYDDGGQGANSRGTFNVTTGGTFYLSVSSFGGAAVKTGTYKVSVLDLTPVADDFAANTSTTGQVAVGGTTTGTLETATDADWFRVTLTAGHVYRIDVEGSPTSQGTISDPVVEVRSSAGAVLATYDDGGVMTNSRGSFTASASGTHFLAVSSFSDAITKVGTYRISVMDLTVQGSQTVLTASSNILRQMPTTAVNNIANGVSAGAITQQAGIDQLIQLADATTSVATLSYQFFTGRIPSQGGIDFLVSPNGPNPNNLNSAYFQSFNLENRYINFAVNLGKFGDGAAFFNSTYGGLSLFEATRLAYATIFGATITDAKVSSLLDPVLNLGGGVTATRAEYFAIFGGDGVNGIGTKAAMVGFLLAEAVKADLGVYARSNAAFLADLADGAMFGVDLIGVYSRPEYVFVGG